ncbi:hypothetical protein E2C01_083104 [Portunus trituberculatus]|uniref:Secreted protein n=1 Tax=Portunus trituberculatus TaxID=210409 RepID=A0A5B7J2K0_PORTR|nr:hypothetical protein [Portunus trituberculatus]
MAPGRERLVPQAGRLFVFLWINVSHAALPPRDALVQQAVHTARGITELNCSLRSVRRGSSPPLIRRGGLVGFV